MIKDCLCWPLCSTLLLQFSFAPPVQSNRKEQHTLFCWVIGGWGCCWIFSLISTVEGWRVIIFFLKAAPSLCVASDNLARNVNLVCSWLSPRPGDLWARPSFPCLRNRAGLGLSTFNSFWVFKMSAFIHFAFWFFFFSSKGDGLST